MTTSVGPSHLSIVPTFDSSVTSSPEATQIEAAFNDAIAAFENTYSDPITVDVNLVWGTTSLGQSSQWLFSEPYATLRAALSSQATASDQISAAAEIPSVDPITSPSTAAGFSSTLPELMALGLLPADCFSTPTCAPYVPTITLNSAAPWTFDPNNRGVSGTYDFIGVAEHELSEVLGRISTLSDGSGSAPSVEDFYRYTASGSQSYVPWASGGYLSVDGGATDLVAFNTNSQGDAADYASGTPDSFNAFASSGVEMPLTQAGLTNMDALGYHRTSTVPLAQSISFTSTPPATPYVGGPPYAVTATGGGSSKPVVFSIDASSSGVCSIASSMVSFLGSGTCTIDANQAGDATYAAASQAQQHLTVSLRPQSISFGALAPETYGHAPFGVSASATSGEGVSFSSSTTPVCTVASSTVTIVGAGVCTITAAQGGDTTWGPATSVVRSFSVAKAPLSVTAHDASITYGQALPAFGYVVGGLVNADGASVVQGVVCTTGGSTTPKAGTYPISCAGGHAANYVLHFQPGTLTVRYGLSKVSPREAGSYHHGAPISVKLQLTDVHGVAIPQALAAGVGCALTVQFDSSKPVCATYAFSTHFFHASVSSSQRRGSHVVTIRLKVGAVVLASSVIDLTAT